MNDERYGHFADKPYLRASFRLLTTDEGGRSSAILGSSYRPNWSVGVEPDTTGLRGAVLFTESGEPLAPGESAEVRLFPFAASDWEGVTVGTQLCTFEGLRLVGRADVTHALSPPDRK